MPRTRQLATRRLVIPSRAHSFVVDLNLRSWIHAESAQLHVPWAGITSKTRLCLMQLESQVHPENNMISVAESAPGSFDRAQGKIQNLVKVPNKNGFFCFAMKTQEALTKIECSELWEEQSTRKARRSSVHRTKKQPPPEPI